MKINLDDLPKWSPWPSRLLFSPRGPRRKGTSENINEEFQKFRYGKLLSFYKKRAGDVGPEECRLFLISLYWPEGKMPVLKDNEILVATGRQAISWYIDLARTKMQNAIAAGSSIIELGCGMGYNLWRLWKDSPDKLYWGGDLAENAVSLASDLFSGISAINVEQFDFYGAEYKILEKAKPPIVIFTMHAIEQLPSASNVVKILLQYRDKISSVFHFEPVYELHDTETLFGLMRHRYTELLDYNKDLLSQLKGKKQDIKIIRIDRNILGLNPLNPTSVIEWEFTKTEKGGRGRTA